MKNLLLAGLLTLSTIVTARAEVVEITFDTIGMIGYDEENLYVEDGFSFSIIPDLSVSNHLDGTNPVVLHTSTQDAGMFMTYSGKRFSLLSFEYATLSESNRGVIIESDRGATILPNASSDYDSVSGVLALFQAQIDLHDITWAVIRGGDYLAFDNLVVETAPNEVPTPSTVATLGLALAGLVAFGRKAERTPA